MALIDWDDIDGGELDTLQRNAVDLGHALLHAAGRGDREKTLIMLDMLAALILYGIFGRNAEKAAVTHANHVMVTVDDIEAKFDSLARRLQ